MAPEQASSTSLVLASSSSYRAELLARLGVPFLSASPNCDESRMQGEAPEALAGRLALTKASCLISHFPDHRIIGSDQVASASEQTLGKPGSRENARAQLASMSGQEVMFYTALCVIDTAQNIKLACVHETKATLRKLSSEEIERYVAADNPLDCAGSFKVESLGISLFEGVESNDPTALIGLPLIELGRFLRQLGYAIP